MHQPKKENRFVFADLIHQQMFSFHPSHNDESERDYTVYKERGRVQGRRIQTFGNDETTNAILSSDKRDITLQVATKRTRIGEKVNVISTSLLMNACTMDIVH